MTAVNDDMNTLFYNPAGLAFLRKSTMTADIGVTMSNRLGSTMPTLYLPNIGKGSTCYNANNVFDNEWYDYYSALGEETVYDEETGRAVSYDFTQLDAYLTGEYAPVDADNSGDISDDEYFAAYQKRQEAEWTYNSFAYSTITLNPRFLVGGKGWGAGILASYELTPVTPTDENGTETVTDLNYVDYDVKRRYMAAVGTGFKFGPFAVGANARYIMDSQYVLEQVGVEMIEDSVVQGLFSPDAATVIESDADFKVGIGALWTLGTLNIGIYNDNVMPFIDQAEMTDGFFNSILDSSNIGISWMPSDNKVDRKFPLNLLISADINNFGDPYYRQLAAGAELGLNFSDFLVATGRVGYAQPIGIGKEIDEIFTDDTDVIDIESGIFSAGITAQLWFAKVDIGVSMPLSSFRYLTGTDEYILDMYESNPDYNQKLFDLHLSVAAKF